MNIRKVGRCRAASSLAILAMGQAAGEPGPEEFDWFSELSGVWSGIYTTPANEGWRVEDFYCPVGCSAATYARLRELLIDAANAAIDFDTLVERAEAETPALAALLTPAAEARHRAFERHDDPSLRCEPKGLARQAVNPLPLEISVYPGHLTIRYEQWQAERTIWLDAAPEAGDRSTLLGTSVGRLEGQALIVETTGIDANILTTDGVPHSDALRIVERYVLTDGATRLELTLTLHDPVMFREPVVMTKAWLRTPAEQILEERCEIISGQP